MKKYLILLLSIFLVGCQNYKELNNSAIVSAIGIDKVKDNYKVSIEVINTDKTSDEQKNLEDKIVYSATGKNITEAINDISFKSPKMLYLGHLELVIVSENLAKDGLREISDYFLRSNQINKNFTILVSRKSTPEEVLSSPTPLTNFPSGNILGSVEISSSISGVSSDVKFLSFIDNLKKNGKNPVMSSITLIKDKDTLQIDDLAVFNDDKLIGYLDKADTKGYNFITNNIKTAIIDFKCNNDKYVGVKISNSKTEVKANLKSDIPEVIINVKSSGEVMENNCNSDIKTIKKKSENEISKLINNSIDKVKEEYNSDIFGFGNLIYKRNPSYFKNFVSKNKDYLFKIKTNINVNIDFDNKGNIID